MSPGWAASVRRLEPEKQKLSDLWSGSYEGSPRGKGAGNGGRGAVGTARAGDGAEASRALVTGGAGHRARACGARRWWARQHAPGGHGPVSYSLSWLFPSPADNPWYRTSDKSQLSVMPVFFEHVQHALLKQSV